MRAVAAALLFVLMAAARGVPAIAHVDRLKWCDQVCRDRLVPCNGYHGDGGAAKLRSSASGPVSWRQIRGLTPRQRAFCRRHRDLVPALVEGARRGARECRRRFRHSRWNCQALGQHLEFGHVQVKGTREAAVQYALHSAAITHALHRACQRGTLATCSCGAASQRRRTLEQWKWTGCLSGLSFSARKARKFVNAREVELDARSRMNVHNNKVGIRMVTRRTRRRSLCHGVSGSCALSTSWQEAPRSFSAIGVPLAAERERSVMVVLSPAGSLLKAATGAPPSSNRLVHLELSPSYCESDPDTGFQGTAGRPCRKNSSVAGSCADLCCDRGHSSRVVPQVFCCNFHTNSAKPSRCRHQTRVRTCN
ncbi:protein Wnt-7b-like [Pollicipes pollicipes]|uniref:protein Wnt-7b-like n=1 Tax=Pollicipes pollicipes TaxID=41117 RepID=UPI0018856212|nr:protein Wnt-7b-like [Pollicipes pollicipes]